MSFFTTSTGENAAATATGEFNAGGGDFAANPQGHPRACNVRRSQDQRIPR